MCQTRGSGGEKKTAQVLLVRDARCGNSGISASGIRVGLLPCFGTFRVKRSHLKIIFKQCYWAEIMRKAIGGNERVRCGKSEIPVYGIRVALCP